MSAGALLDTVSDSGYDDKIMRNGSSMGCSDRYTDDNIDRFAASVDCEKNRVTYGSNNDASSNINSSGIGIKSGIDVNILSDRGQSCYFDCNCGSSYIGNNGIYSFSDVNMYSTLNIASTSGNGEPPSNIMANSTTSSGITTASNISGCSEGRSSPRYADLWERVSNLPVNHANLPVSHTNISVSHVNLPVSHANLPVSHASILMTSRPYGEILTPVILQTPWNNSFYSSGESILKFEPVLPGYEGSHSNPCMPTSSNNILPVLPFQAKSGISQVESGVLQVESGVLEGITDNSDFFYNSTAGQQPKTPDLLDFTTELSTVLSKRAVMQPYANGTNPRRHQEGAKEGSLKEFDNIYNMTPFESLSLDILNTTEELRMVLWGGGLAMSETPLAKFEAPLAMSETPLAKFEAPLVKFEAPLARPGGDMTNTSIEHAQERSEIEHAYGIPEYPSICRGIVAEKNAYVGVGYGDTKGAHLHVSAVAILPRPDIVLSQTGVSPRTSSLLPLSHLTGTPSYPLEHFSLLPLPQLQSYTTMAKDSPKLPSSYLGLDTLVRQTAPVLARAKSLSPTQNAPPSHAVLPDAAFSVNSLL